MATGILLWLFGVATSVTLVSVWGRSLSSSPSVIAAVARSGIDAGWVADQVLAELTPVVGARQIESSAEYRDMAERLAEEVVTALVDDDVSTLDMAEVLRPIIERWGPEAPEVVTVVESLPPIEIRPPTHAAPLGPEGSVTAYLTAGAGLGLTGMLVMGGGLTWLAENRRLMIRSLLNRMTVSALTFALMLRVGSWVVDPRGGRSPLRAVAGEALSTRWWLPAVVGATAGIVSWTLVRTRRRVSPPPD